MKKIPPTNPKEINNRFEHSEKQLFRESDDFLKTFYGKQENIYIYMFTYFSPCLDGKDACWKLIYDKAVEYKQKYNVQHIYVAFHKVYLPKDLKKSTYKMKKFNEYTVKCLVKDLNQSGHLTMWIVPYKDLENILSSLQIKFPIPSDG